MKRWIFLLMFIVLIGQGFTAGTSISTSFNPGVDVSFESGIIYSDALTLVINTPERVLCRYSDSEGISFDSMTKGFGENYETVHKEVFTGLHDGVHRKYVKCRDIDDLGNTSKGVATLEVVLKISNPIAGQVVLDEGTHLKEGKYEVTLVTTKIPSGTPKLSYSYNGIVYNPIILQGGNTVWTGYIFIPKDEGEKVGSFKFEATDLENRKGTKIVGDVVFSVDTIIPKTINTIEAVGDYGEIRLDWHLDEEVDKVFIYRSEEPGVDQTDFFEEVNGDRRSFVDTEVSNGKTYYYKVSTQDNAGNIGSLSREISSTALLSSSASKSNSGLAVNLRGLVDNVITEIELLEDDLESVESNYDLDEKSEKIFEGLGLEKEVSGVKSELGALKKEVSNYKLQELTRETLETKLNSASLKLNILKKKVPESFIILGEVNLENSINEEVLRRIILEYMPELSESEVSSKVKKSLKEIKDNEVSFRGTGYTLEVVYLDGTRKEFSFVGHEVSSSLERDINFKIMVLLPDSLVSSGNLKVNNADYNFESDTLLAFGSDAKSIKYYVDKEVGEGTFEDIRVSLVDVSISEDNLGITGYSIFDFSGESSLGFSILIFLVFMLAGYWGYLKFVQKTGSEKDFVREFISKARSVKELQKSGDLDKANELYDSLKADYLEMDNHEKKLVFKEIKQLHGGK